MLFEESLIVTLPNRKKGRIRWYLVGTVIGYSFIVASLLVGSILLFNPQLNQSLADSVLVAPPPPPPPPPPPAAGSQKVPQAPKVQLVTTAFVPPTITPRRLPTASDLPTVDAVPGGGVPGGIAGGVPGGVVGGVLGGVVGGVLGAPPTVAAAPPPAPEPEPAPTKPRSISTGLLLGNSIRQVQPAYPLVARNAQLEGAVEVQIIVDEQGNVIAVEVLSGHPLLRQPALDAARQWKFRPTLLNGQPIKVSGILRFTFRLS
jgi:protein TonB